MATDIQTLRPYLQNFDLTGLMVEGLGWNHHQSAPIVVIADNESYDLHTVSEKAGFAAYRCSPKPDGTIPPQNARRQIENQVSKTNYEHLIIFVDATETRQVWQWVKRESGRPPAVRELRYDKGQTGTALLQRLRGIEFTLEEEGNLGIIDVTEKFQQSLDVERVTKRFYDRFRNELTAFQKFISGFTNQGDRDWYASLMLNRMMFVYFIQKQLFLDGDEHYLGNRLEKVQEQDGPDQFMRFYRKFLLRLFHEGLGQPEADRSAELNALLGKVPYLNGGIFDPHTLEQDNPDINIPDAAFEQIFLFFDQYQWHLDDRPSGADNEINPDVLGYIFEKYVNQKQMGAYYTKEDITGYIARNTVIPRLLEIAQTECPIAFGLDGGVWRLLQDDPDNYIYQAVGHGIAWNYSPESVSRLEEPLALPEHIARGLDDTTQRVDWNQAAPKEYALPTETWRELIARRQRYAEVRDKLDAGDVQSVNDLVTLNLDSERFARDVIVNSEGPELVRAIWNGLTKMSVLDPACGSGAFLFASLNILEPLYSATMQAMRGFLADLETAKRPRPPKALYDFRNILGVAGQHRNERYYILKSIIVNNLYGVDIMEEAVEICRLRLFLKLAAQLETYDQIEPLPDIDFNIQAGNSLVGFTTAASVRKAMEVDIRGQRRMMTSDDEAALRRIETKATEIAREYQHFQQIQTEFGMGYADLAHSKQGIQSNLDDLREELDALLAKEYAVNANQAAAFQKWQASHQPFHWFVEFHSIMQEGGFGVIVGNPPYVQWTKVTDYRIHGYATAQCPDMFAAFIEQVTRLSSRNNRYGMIVPISFQFSDDFAEARKVLRSATNDLWVSTFSRNPAALFNAGLGVRNSICVGHSTRDTGDANIFTTRLNRWTETFRPCLFDSLEYTALPSSLTHYGWPRIGSTRISNLFEKLVSKGKPIGGKSGRRGKNHVRFKTTALYYISAFTNDPPSFNESGTPIAQTEIGTLSFEGPESQKIATALAMGKIALVWWAGTGDDFHVTASGLSKTPIRFDELPPESMQKLANLYEQMQGALSANVMYTRYAEKWMGNYDVKCIRHLTDQADQLVLDHLGLAEYWEDLELEYIRFFKMTGERPGTIRELPNFSAGGKRPTPAQRQ